MMTMMKTMKRRSGGWQDLVKPKKAKKKRRNDEDEEEKNPFSTIPDDMLFEILIRLPSIVSAIRSSVVCRGWSSIINTHRSHYISTFIPHFRSKTPAVRLLFSHKSISRTPILIHNHLPQTSSVYPSTLSHSLPGFHDLCTGALVAANGDLLLVNESSSYHLYCPITGLHTVLPQHPSISGELINCGLALQPNMTTHSNRTGLMNSKVRVMLVFRKDLGDGNYMSSMTMFCSENWKWTKAMPAVPSENDELVACDELLCYINSEMRCLVVLNLFEDGDDRQGYIALPREFYSSDYSESQLRLGVCEGRPRISHLFRVDGDHLCLKVWEVNNNEIKGGEYEFGAGGRLVLVHQVKIKASAAAADDDDGDLHSMPLFVLAFHPLRDDRIFMLRDTTISQEDLNMEKRLKIAEILSVCHTNTRVDLRVFPFVNRTVPHLVTRFGEC